MEDLDRLRSEIDLIDREMAELFRTRMSVVKQIGAYKEAHGLPVIDPVREAAVLEQMITASESELNALYSAFHRCVVKLSGRYQEILRGPQGALHLDLEFGNCDIILERGCLARADTRMNLSRRVMIVADDGVPEQYVRAIADRCSAPQVFTAAQGEKNKTFPTLACLLDAMLDHGMTRRDCVVAVGGGLVSDLAGFAASIYARGMECCYVPTTLLAQLDAAVGGKTGLNYRGIKNAVGTFSQPRCVLIDPQVLDTLPARQIASGLSEALKVGVTLDPELFSLFESPRPTDHMDEIIRRAVTQKIAVVSADGRESGLRRVLNFGHTIGHAIEMAHPEMSHGECVALGMLAMCSEAVYDKLIPIYEKLRLPTCCTIDPEQALALIAHDKKRVGTEVLAVEVPEIGRFVIRPLALEEWEKRLSRIAGEV